MNVLEYTRARKNAYCGFVGKIKVFVDIAKTVRKTTSDGFALDELIRDIERSESELKEDLEKTSIEFRKRG